MFICDISVLNRYGKQRLDELLSELCMDWHMLVALLVVEQAPGISQARLSIFLQTDKANVSKILKSMEQRGLIRRVADPADLRNKICYAASEGRLLAPQMWKILDLWENECFQNIDQEDLEVFQRVNNTICQTAMPLYRYLTTQKGFEGLGKGIKAKALETMLKAKYRSSYNDSQIKWNFTKFLVDRSGSVVARFEPTVEPKDIAADIEKLL